MDKRTTGYFAVTDFQPGFETQDEAVAVAQAEVRTDPSTHISVIYVQLLQVLTGETQIDKTNDNNPFRLATSGSIDNDAPIDPEVANLAETRKMLNQAAALVTKTQLELKTCRARIHEQEGELADLREELIKPTGE